MHDRKPSAPAAATQEVAGNTKGREHRARRSALLRIAVFLTLFGVGMIACQDTPMSPPPIEPVPGPNLAMSSGEPLAEFTLPLAGTNDGPTLGAFGGAGLTWGGTGARQTVGTVPANMLVHIRVRGAIEIAMNPDHDFYFNSNYPLAGTEVGPQGRGGSIDELKVNLYAKTSSGSESFIYLSPVSATEVDAWVKYSQDMSITVGRNGLVGGCSCLGRLESTSTLTGHRTGTHVPERRSSSIEESDLQTRYLMAEADASDITEIPGVGRARVVRMD